MPRREGSVAVLVISEATRDELLTLVVRQELDRSLSGLVTCR